MSGKPAKPKGEIQFLEHHWPSLPAGDYTVEVSQAIASTEPVLAKPGAPPPAARTFRQELFEAAPRQFSVLGPRFSLEPEMIRTVFPPPGSLGEHSSVLPHVTFTRSTLPWERQPAPLSEAEDEALAHSARAGLFDKLLRGLCSKADKTLEKATPKQQEAWIKKALEKDTPEHWAGLYAEELPKGLTPENSSQPVPESHQWRVGLFKQLLAEHPPATAGEKALTDAALKFLAAWNPAAEVLQEAHDKKETPWLALLLFDQDEIEEQEGIDTKDAVVLTCELAMGDREFVLDLPQCIFVTPDEKRERCAGKPVGDSYYCAEHQSSNRPLTKVQAPGFALEKGQQAGEPVTVLDVRGDLLKRILPSKEEIRPIGEESGETEKVLGDAGWLAHARRATDEHGNPISQELATVLCNRLPGRGRTSVVHLVSLEGRYEAGDLWDQVAQAPDAKPKVNKDKQADRFGEPRAERIRLVSLKSWRFACVAEEHSFKGLLHGLDYGSVPPPKTAANGSARTVTRRTPTTLRLPEEDPTGANRPLTASTPYLRSGFVAAPHQMRDGNRSVSWYRGPLAPGPAEKQLPEKVIIDGEEVETLPARSADQLVRYFAECGMFDVSYSAAWELGRLLTLQNRSVAVDLLNWKRRHRHGQEQETARRELVHLPIEGQSADAALPRKVSRWFHDLSLLKGLPFNYLVPDERMLPQESLRFFWVDYSWVRCLLDGAFSVGRALPSDFKRDRGHERPPHAARHGVVTGFLLRSQVVSGWPDLQVEGYEEQVEDEDYERPEVEVAGPILPIITLASTAEADELASRLDQGDVSEARRRFHFPPEEELLVSRYEGDASLSTESPTRPAVWVANRYENRDDDAIYLIRRLANRFTVKREKKLHLLRMARLSPNVLLCLFAGEVKTVDIHQKPEALHFGVNRSNGEPRRYYRELKSRTGGELTGVSVDISWRGASPDDRVLEVTALAGTMKKRFQNLIGPKAHWSDEDSKALKHLFGELRDLPNKPKNLEEFVKQRAGFKSFTPAQFALQMVEGVQKVRFPCAKT